MMKIHIVYFKMAPGFFELSSNKYIVFCLVRSHRDITGNEYVDYAAKDALSTA